MIQKKREQFRLSIRRRQIEALFRDIRLDLLEPKASQQNNQFFKESPFSQSILMKLKQIRMVIQSNNENEILAHFFALKQSIMGEVSAFSAYFFVFSKQFNILTHSLLENKTVISEGQKQWRSVTQSIKKNSVIHLLDIYLLVSYENIKKQSFEVILESLLKYFDYKQFLFVAQDKAILEKIIQVFKRILETNNKLIIQALLQSYFEGVIQEILNRWKSLTITNVIDLLFIIYRYLFLESSLKKNQYSAEFDGIAVLGNQSSSKAAILIFSTQTLEKKIKGTQLFCLSIIQLLFQRHSYLIDSLPLKAIKALFSSILQFEPSCIKKGLQLASDIVYHSQSIVEDLLEQNFISDITLKIINYLEKFPYKDVRQYAYLLCCIITNLSLCRKRKLIESFMMHPLWQKVYESIRMGSPMLPLVGCFQFFFQKVSKKIGIQTFDRYLFSISQLDLKMIDRRQQKAIFNTIQRTFIHCIDFWPQQNDIRLKRLINQYNLGYIIQELMIPQEQQMQMNCV